MIKLKKLQTIIKNLFSKKKSPEALKMWDDLKDDYDGDPEFHPSLRINIEYYMSIETQAGKDRYLFDLMRRRQKAHDNSL